MKKTDIAMIVLIASVSVGIAFFVTKSILGEQVSDPVTVKTVEAIDASMTDPDPAIFNAGAINPTVEVQIDTGSQ